VWGYRLFAGQLCSRTNYQLFNSAIRHGQSFPALVTCDSIPDQAAGQTHYGSDVGNVHALHASRWAVLWFMPSPAI
jgi:hypothetical protein